MRAIYWLIWAVTLPPYLAVMLPLAGAHWLAERLSDWPWPHQWAYRRATR